MKRAEETFKEEGLRVIWMGFQDGKEQIIDFMTKHDIESYVAYDDRNIIASQYGIAYGAGLILINKEGIVTRKIPKGFSEDELVSALEQAIFEKTGDAGNGK